MWPVLQPVRWQMSPQSHCCLPGHQPLLVLRCHSAAAHGRAAAHGLQSKLHISGWAVEGSQSDMGLQSTVDECPGRLVIMQVGAA